MPQAHSKDVWCLERANEPPCVVSARELLILAELGHLRADDLIWRSGSSAKQSIRSLLAAQKTSPAPKKPVSKPPSPKVTAPALLPAQEAPSKASPVAPVSGTEAHGPHRKWASGRTLAGVASAAVVLAALGIAAFLQSQPAEPPKPIATRLEAQSAEPAAADASTSPQPPVTTDEVAVRKVKVLDIPPPPPGQ